MAQSDMVERVAKAMYPWAWDKANHRDARRTAMARARTAIEAMSEPTPVMLKAGSASNGWFTVGEEEAGLCFKAMIAAAIRATPEE